MRDIHTDVGELAMAVTGADVQTALSSDPLADGFDSVVYGDGQTTLMSKEGTEELSTLGQCMFRLEVQAEDAAGVKRWNTGIISREQLRRLRDGADVILRATAKSGEVA